MNARSPSPTLRVLFRTLRATFCTGLVAGLCLAASAQTPRPTIAKAQLAAGPMLGATDMHTSTIWLQANRPGHVVVEYWPVASSSATASGVQSRPGAGIADTKRSTPIRLSVEQDHVAHVRLSGLAQATRYAYRVLLDGRPVSAVQHLQTQTRWIWRKDVPPPDFTALMGSCHYPNDAPRDRDGKPFGAGFEIFGAMAAQRPDLMLWLGDYTYFRENEHTSAEGMRHRYRVDRAMPELQPLLRVGQHAAIWDDHDFGPDDANAAFNLKDEALGLFKRYWANGSYGLPGTPGVFGSFSFSDADFFMLDNRYYRDADRAKNLPDKTQFGAAQMRWLKNALLMSTAPLKIIAGGSQVLNDQVRGEGWVHFAEERREFLEWLLANRIDGVVFLSGDRHFTELSRLDRPGTYPLLDLTCSPLTAGAFGSPRERGRPGQVSGTVVEARNFCSLSVQGVGADRALILKSFDTQGKELWMQRVGLKDLRTPG